MLPLLLAGAGAYVGYKLLGNDDDYDDRDYSKELEEKKQHALAQSKQQKKQDIENDIEKFKNDSISFIKNKETVNLTV